MKAFVEINGRGGEIVISSLNDDAYTFWTKQSVEKLSDYVLGNQYFPDIPVYADFIKDENGDNRQWYDLDDRGHFFGAHPKHCSLRVDIETGATRKTVIDQDFGSAIRRTKSKLSTHTFSNDPKSRRPALIGFSYEKGCFYEASFEISGKDDFRNLVFRAINVNSSETIIYGLTNNNTDIENLGGDTTGKGLFFTLASV